MCVCARVRACMCVVVVVVVVIAVQLTNGCRSRLPPTLLMKNFRSPEAKLAPFTSLWRLTILLPSQEKSAKQRISSLLLPLRNTSACLAHDCFKLGLNKAL